jgi:hypothetical protein
MSEAAHARIRANIEKDGQHVYFVLGSSYPRFIYSIGLSPRVGFELIIGGSAFYSRNQVVGAIHEAAPLLTQSASPGDTTRLSLPFGEFSVRHVHESWAAKLALGAFDYYDNDKVQVRQLVPSADAWTIDVPDMSIPWKLQEQPVWRGFTSRGRTIFPKTRSSGPISGACVAKR